jgi:hypothetical protein
MDLEEKKIGLISLEIQPVAECCEHGNEPLDSIKSRELLDELIFFSSRTVLHGVMILLIKEHKLIFPGVSRHFHPFCGFLTMEIIHNH